VTEWNRIDSAPKDGTHIRLWNGIESGDGYYEQWGRDELGNVIGAEPEIQNLLVDGWMWCGEGFSVDPLPTHWLPLPPPPVNTEQQS
jgi:hypothetical protein